MWEAAPFVSEGPVSRGFKPCARLPPAVDLLVFGTGTVIARQAHVHLPHGGPFEACERCRPATWIPARDMGVLIHDARGRLVERSDAVRRLFVP